ncbi:MAG: PilZ domain-containing protein [Phycisphaerae bacterium]
MNQGCLLDPPSRVALLNWGAENRVELAVSCAVDGGWASLRSRLIRFDPHQDVLQIDYPLMQADRAPAEFPIGTELGLSFRRGHKKCLFVSPVVLRRTDTDEAGGRVDTLILRAPRHVRALQRRAYQRIIIPSERFIAVKLWEGGVPRSDLPSWPICAGRVANISVGGVQVDIRTDRNPRLSTGDILGIEITVRPGTSSLLLEGRYRHCLMRDGDRLGLGFQFVGLEHERPERSSITELAEFVRSLRRNRRGG